MAEASDGARRYSASARLRNFTHIPNEVLRSTSLSGNAKALYAILFDIVVYQREEPDLVGLGRLLGGGEKTARTAVRDLEGADLLLVRRRGRGSPQAYELLEPPERRVFDSETGPEGGSSRARDSLSRVKTGDPADHPLVAVRVIAETWLASSPPLIGHRESYFQSSKATTAIRAALRIYPVETVVEAITNYATCLGSDDYRWSYSWTLADFLRRGLDKFVPEAQPLENFRARRRVAGEHDLPDF